MHHLGLPLAVCLGCLFVFFLWGPKPSVVHLNNFSFVLWPLIQYNSVQFLVFDKVSGLLEILIYKHTVTMLNKFRFF